MSRESSSVDFTKAFESLTGASVAIPMTKGSIYVAGPWRGHPEGNKASFDAVEQMLVRAGWGPVYNPHKLNEDNGVHFGQPIEDAIRFDIEAILKSNAICLLPGWRNSEGARTIEVPMAARLGLDFYKAEVQAKGDAGEDLWNYVAIDTPSAEVEGIDQEARRGVYGEKAQVYGHPRGDFECIAGIWMSMIRAKVDFISGFNDDMRVGDIPWDKVVTDELVSTMMSGFKLARQVKSPKHRDTQVDVIGYQLTLARLQEDPAEVAASEVADYGKKD